MSNAGSSTIKGPFIANGGAAFSNNNFTIDVNSGNTDINGMVTIHNDLTIDNNLFVEGNLSCASGAFTMNEDVGGLNVTINGLLTVTGATTYYDTFKLSDSNNTTIINLSSNSDGKSYFLGGNVGFGISNPEYKLDIFGDINVSNGSTYKIDGVDVVFSQWETVNFSDISFNSGNIFINVDNGDIPTNTSSIMTINGVVTINNGDIILNGLTFSENVTNLIPASPWVNSPTGSTMEDGNIDTIYTNYTVLMAKNLAIGISESTNIDDNTDTSQYDYNNTSYALTVGGDTNMIGDLYFNGAKFIANIWKTYDNPNADNLDSQYVYFSTTNDPSPGISYVGIGNSAPQYNLDVNGDVNITGNLLINGNGVIFPTADDGTISTQSWVQGPVTPDGTVLYYNAGFIGIGTEAPQNLLSVSGTYSQSELLNLSTQSGMCYISLSKTTTTLLKASLIGFTENTSELTFKNLLTDGPISIENSTGSGLIYMDLNGNIGIGTNTPSDKFHVKGGATFEDNITIGTNGTSIILNNPTSAGTAQTDNNSRIALEHGNNDMLYMDPDGGYTGGIKLGGAFCIIPQSNNLNFIGIAQNIPQYQLDINGDFNFTGSVYKNGLIQYFSQWSTNGDPTTYIQYPSQTPNMDTRAYVGIGTGGLPDGCLEVFDRTVSPTGDYFPQLVLKTSIDNYNSNDQGACIELNSFYTTTSTTYKGIRLHSVDEGLTDDNLISVGFAIDSNNNSTSAPFKNLLYMTSSGNLGIGNFLNYAAEIQIPSANLHIIDSTSALPAVIISDNENQIANLKIISSLTTTKSNVGKYSKIIGVNIQDTVSNDNTVVQDTKTTDSCGAVAINLSAGGSKGGADSNTNGSAFSLLTTDPADSSAGSGIPLDETFSIAYNGNVGIRSYSSSNFISSPPYYGLNINYSDKDTDANNRPTGSINVTGYYYQNGERLHLPWTYWTSNSKDSDGNTISLTQFSQPFDLGYATASTDTLDTTIIDTLNNVIQQVDSVVGIGTTQPRGALDVRGSLYSNYTVLSTNKINAFYNSSIVSIYHSRFEALDDPDNPTKFCLFHNDDGNTSINAVGSDSIVELSIDARAYLTCGYNSDSNMGLININGDVDINSGLNAASLDITSTCTIGSLNCLGTGVISGNFTCNSTVYGVEFRATSDIRLKEDILPLENALEKINNINGVSFKFKNSDKTQIGFIAQDIEKTIPELVDIKPNETNKEEYKTVAYGNMTAMLVEAVKELTQQNKELLKRIEVLEQNP